MLNDDFEKILPKARIKPFNRLEILGLIERGCKEALLGYDLSGADLSDLDLSGINFSGNNLSHSQFNYSDLSRCKLSCCDLSGASLMHANLTYASLSGANLIGANMDFSCLPLRCGGLKWKIDKRIACQIAYHFCSMKCDDEEFIKARNSILDFANKFHRVEECGKLLGSGE